MFAEKKPTDKLPVPAQTRSGAETAVSRKPPASFHSLNLCGSFFPASPHHYNHRTMSVTLHTTHGPLKLELFVEACPKTCENFLALCASGYYDDVPFHRNLAGFMTQTGDGELKTGKGGKSIWGGYFTDEISPALRHNARGIVSMANKGEGTNGSQFFICYAPQKHLDGRNTVFGKVSGRREGREGERG